MPTIEFLVLADRAEAFNGKLYLFGGCWDRVVADGPDHVQILSVAVSVLLQPEDLEREHTLRIVVGAPALPPLTQAQAVFPAGQSVSRDELSTQRMLVCLPGSAIRFPTGGVYEAVARLDDGPEVRTPFLVTFRHQAAMDPPSPDQGAHTPG